jgi:hypothetical protein
MRRLQQNFKNNCSSYYSWRRKERGSNSARNSVFKKASICGLAKIIMHRTGECVFCCWITRCFQSLRHFSHNLSDYNVSSLSGEEILMEGWKGCWLLIRRIFIKYFIKTNKYVCRFHIMYN